ncbi:S1C family serine protease [Jidongwangia harbinensis]|uniref:S1C family serine protease n=1 Tax=Jidongwangia harbinensis TaxID=2878561 RepID=UPI001CD9872A|nr:trypsin-like peptidase domain-containing protein [Jidongwangia harbinensis]MCA2213451.1 trypsin-like peptidase domain-containing protein [Jidongwangia harbinensis]
MNEHETNPQRHETPATEPSHRPADAPFGGISPERGQSEPSASQPTPDESTAAQPTVAQPTVDQPAAAQPVVDEPTAAQPTVTHPTAGQPAAGQPAAGQPAAGQPAVGQPGVPQPVGAGAAQGGPWGPSPWQRAGQQPYGPPQQPGYGQPYPTQTPFGYQQHPGAPAYPHQPGHEQPGPEQPAQNSAPPWAQPVGVEQRDPARAGRGRRIFAAGAAAVLIALAGGGVGAATVLAMDSDGTPPIQTGNSSVTRMVDRSSLAQIAALVQDSVVSIGTGSGEGSGVVLNTDGYVLTNNHVVASAQNDAVEVVFANGKKSPATIVGTDPRTDLAVVKTSETAGLKPATFGDSSQMQVGDTVLALGSPLGLAGSVTAGIVSAKDRTIRSNPEQQAPPNPFGGQEQQQSQAPTSMSGLLQTDAPINPGNSGGALVNTDGQVIGINTAIATSGQGSGNIGVGFAIPSNRAKQVAGDLIAGRKVSHPALGVKVAEVEGGGALIREVTPDSAAAKAGLQQGDVVTAINGKPVNGSDDLIGVVQTGKVGDRVTVQFKRDGAEKTVTATLAETQ